MFLIRLYLGPTLHFLLPFRAIFFFWPFRTIFSFRVKVKNIVWTYLCRQSTFVWEYNPIFLFLIGLTLEPFIFYCIFSHFGPLGDIFGVRLMFKHFFWPTYLNNQHWLLRYLSVCNSATLPHYYFFAGLFWGGVVVPKKL